MESIGDWIKKCRSEREWSRAKLASQMEVAQVSIGIWENDKSFPKESNLRKLEELFDEPRPNGGNDLNRLLEVLSRHGSAGNMKLRDELGWTEKRYWTVRAEALQQGLIVLGKGKGGSVRLVRKTVEQDLERFIKALSKQDGGKCGNSRLRKILDWDEERYEDVEERAVEEGRITRGPAAAEQPF